MRSNREIEDVNLTEISEIYKKHTHHYNEHIHHYKVNEQTKIFLEKVCKETNIPIEKLISTKEISGKSCYMAHPIVGHDFREWCKKERKRQGEEEIKTRLQKKLGGEIEVLTNTGLIDLLTEKEIIEIKSVKTWIHGVGQLIVRGRDYPHHSKRLHLFGKFSTKSRIKNLELIQKSCIPLGIEVTWEGQSDSERVSNSLTTTMHPILKFDISELSVSERIQLAEDLWDSILNTPDEVPLNDEQKQELDRRLEMHRQNANQGSNWQSVKQRLGLSE